MAATYGTEGTGDGPRFEVEVGDTVNMVTAVEPAQRITGLRLALGHQARVGKDTFADYVIARHGGVKLAIAAPIYAIADKVQRVLGRHQVKDPGLLQLIGTELRAHYGDDVWIEQAVKRVYWLCALQPEVNIVVVDMRFPNEMKALREAGFSTVKVVRPRRIIDRDPTHVSETALAGAEFDHTIINDGDMATYWAAIDSLLDCLTGRGMDSGAGGPAPPFESATAEGTDGDTSEENTRRSPLPPRST